MKKAITSTLSEAKGKFEGYTALLDFRYSNLCVEADARALLPVTVTIDGTESNIEKVAWINNPEKDQFAVYPMDQYDLLEIGAGIQLSHPEFKMEVKDWENFPEEMKTEGDVDEYKYLLFTMPEVNKDRRDFLLDGVKVLHEQWNMKMELVKTSSAAKLMEYMAGQHKEVIDKTKKQFEDYYKTCYDRGESITEAKKKEIEDGYQRYLEREKEKQVAEKAKGDNVASSMRMGQEPGDDEY